MGIFNPKALIDKIAASLLRCIMPFGDRKQDLSLVRATATASAPAFAAVWNNPEDDAYDAL